jgi:tyrosine-protein kinase Etk/Wzc
MQRDSDKILEVDLLTFFHTLLRQRKLIVYLTGAATIVAAIVVLVIDRYYEANVTVMPSKQKNQFSASSFLKNALPLGGLGLGKTSDDLLTYTTILTSRSAYDRLIGKFNLQEVYDQETMDKTIKVLNDRVEFLINNDETALSIRVYDVDSTRAKEMATYAMEILNELYIALNSVEAKSNRQFIERRYEQTLTDLRMAEDSLRKFQERYGIYTTTDQVKASIVAAAELKSKMVLGEIQLGVLEKTVSKDDPEIGSLKIQLRELERQLSHLQSSSSNAEAEVFIPLGKIPQRGLQYIRLLREIEIQSRIQETLLPLYEQAKIEENRDTPTVVVLDKAYVSNKPVKPKRLIIVLVVFIVSLLLSILLVFLLEYLRRLKGSKEGENEMMRYVRTVLHPKRFFRFDDRTDE